MVAASDPQRVQDYLYSLVQQLTVLGVTCMLVFETAAGALHPEGHAAGARLSYMSDNIVLLAVENGAARRRTLSVLKARATAHDLRSHDVTIDAAGVSLPAA